MIYSRFKFQNKKDYNKLSHYLTQKTMSQITDNTDKFYDAIIIENSMVLDKYDMFRLITKTRRRCLHVKKAELKIGIDFGPDSRNFISETAVEDFKRDGYVLQIGDDEYTYTLVSLKKNNTIQDCATSATINTVAAEDEYDPDDDENTICPYV